MRYLPRTRRRVETEVQRGTEGGGTATIPRAESEAIPNKGGKREERRQYRGRGKERRGEVSFEEGTQG